MIKTADIVIIGAGVVGCSIAYHLAKKGCRNIVVLERDVIGAGSTAKCSGGIRRIFAWETEIRMSQEAIKFFENFEQEMGEDPDFRRVGYLILEGTEPGPPQFKRSREQDEKLGLDIRDLSPEEVSALVPGLKVDDLVKAVYSPGDGFLGPHEVTQGFALRARDLGVVFLQQTEATAIKLRGGRVETVVTPKGEIATSTVINAAGAWSPAVGEMVGVELPIKPNRRHIFVTAPFPAAPDSLPMVLDHVQGFSFRKEREGIMFNAGDVTDVENYQPEMDWGVLPGVAEKAARRFPVLEEAQVMTGWAGMRALTPDERAILGRVPEVEGFICACGFSGHGFMHSPATGKLIAELVLDGGTSLDITPLSLERFRK